MDETTTLPPARTAERKSGWLSALYPAVWRWHFWAGLLITPVLLVVSLTGALYVFEEEIAIALQPEMHLVEIPAGGEMLPVSARVEAAKAYLGDGSEWEFSGLSRAGGPGRSDEFYFDRDDPSSPEGHVHHNIYVNPYTGAVLGERSMEGGLFPTVLKLHRTLLAGSFGRYLVELATSWGIVSMLSGILLWWPRAKKKRKGGGGIWYPRLGSGLKVALRDLHAIPGLYLSAAVIAIMFTGLLFTQVWGKGALGLLYVTDQLPPAYVSTPKSTPLAPGATPADVDAVMAEARTHYPFVDYYLGVPHEAPSPWVVYGRTQKGDLDDGVVYIDASTGKTLDVIDYPSLSFPAKAFLTFYAIHIGSIYGLPTQILALLSALLIAAMSITGVWMWWRRRPAGKFGAPKRGKDERVPVPIVITILVLAVIFPVVGASLIVFGIGSFVAKRVFRRKAAIEA